MEVTNYTEEERGLLDKLSGFEQESEDMVKILDDHIKELEKKKEEIYGSLKKKIVEFKKSGFSDQSIDFLSEELENAKAAYGKIQTQIEKAEDLRDKVSVFEKEAIESSARPSVKELIVTGTEKIKEGLTSAMTRAKEAAIGFWNKMRNAFSKTANKISDLYQEKVSQIKDGTIETLSNVKESGLKIGNELSKLSDSITDYTLINVFSPNNMMDEAVRNIAERHSDEPEKGIAGAIRKVSYALDSKTLNTVNVATNLRNNIRSGFETARDTLLNIADKVSQKADKAMKNIKDLIERGKSAARQARIAAVGAVRNAQDFVIGAAHRAAIAAENAKQTAVQIRDEGREIREGSADKENDAPDLDFE